MITHTKLTEHMGIQIELSYQEAMHESSSNWKDLLYTKKVLVFKNWNGLTPEDMTLFGKKFGSPWTGTQYDCIREHSSLASTGIYYSIYNNKNYPKLEDLPWHVDMANEPNLKKYPIRFLYCIELPSHSEGNSTDISNMIQAYKDLSNEEKEYFSNVTFTYQNFYHPGTNLQELSAVEIHPYTNEKFLRFNVIHKDKGWITTCHYKNIDGSVTTINNREMYAYIKEIASRYEYVHNWKVGDLLIFDNWGTIHKKGSETIYDDSTGSRTFIRLTIDNDF